MGIKCDKPEMYVMENGVWNEIDTLGNVCLGIDYGSPDGDNTAVTLVKHDSNGSFSILGSKVIEGSFERAKFYSKNFVKAFFGLYNNRRRIKYRNVMFGRAKKLMRR